MMDKRTTDYGNIFIGAEEYWSYEGLRDGFYNLQDSPYEKIESFPFPKLEITFNCQSCYLLGYFLGKEIRNDYEHEARQRKAMLEIKKYATSIRKMQKSINNLREV